MFGRSLTARFIGVIATVTSVCVVIVSSAVAWSSYRNEEQDAVAETRASSAYLSTQVSTLVAHAAQVTHENHALIVGGLRRGPTDRRAVLADLREALRSQPDLYGTWFIAEDDAFDAADAAHRGAFGSTARGVFSPYWRRDVQDRIVQDRLGAGTARSPTGGSRSTCSRSAPAAWRGRFLSLPRQHGSGPARADEQRGPCRGVEAA